jgi:hypothetical protein
MSTPLFAGCRNDSKLTLCEATSRVRLSVGRFGFLQGFVSPDKNLVRSDVDFRGVIFVDVNAREIYDNEERHFASVSW